MRDYDAIRAERDLSFKIGGEEFTVRMLPMTYSEELIAREDAVDTSNSEGFVQMHVDRVADAVEDGNGAADRWRDLCASDNAPAYGELIDISRWVLEVQFEVPTMQAAGLSRWAWDHRLLIEGRIRLAGGDPSGITLGESVALGYALLVEQYASIDGYDLTTAIATVNANLELEQPQAEVDKVAVAVNENERSLAMLNAAMSGVGGLLK